MEYTEEYIDLKQYWLILRRRWVPALIVMGGVTTLTALITFLQKPVYEAEGKVLLKKDSGITSALESSNLGSLGELAGIGDKSNPISTESEIIKSRPVVQAVIQTLRLQDDDGKVLKLKDFLKKLTVSNAKETDIISVAYKSTDPKEATAVVNQLIDVYRANNIQRMRVQATTARKFIETQIPGAEQEVRRYESAVRQFKERSKVVSLQEEAKVAVEGIGELQKRLTEAEGLLASAENRSRALQRQVGLPPKQALDVNALSQSPTVQKALAELKDVQRALATTKTELQPDHPRVLDLEERQAALQGFLQSQVGQVVGASLATTPGLPTLQASETQQGLTDSYVKTEVERLGIQNQVDTLRQAQGVYRERMTLLPRLEQRQSELQRKLGVAKATFEGLMKSLQQFKISENQNVGNVLPIEAAVIPDKPVSPKILLNLAIGTVMGLLLGIGTALLLEALDNTVKTVKEAEALFDMTVLGKIPLLEGEEKINRKSLERARPRLPVRDNPRSVVSEAYRMLQANLKFLSSDSPPRVMVMTSSVPQEGKSTTTANLALALAEMGHRVLVVDADLRRPSQHQIWELPNSVGLTNILVEPGKWFSVVRSENEQLDIITAGVVPPNPVRLIDSHRMISLIKEWRDVYDFVLIDTPPLAVASDALILAQMTDGILMVARPGVLTSPSAESSTEALAKISNQDNEKRANLLGLVLNGVIPENEPDSYYFYAKNYYAAAEVEFDPSTRNGKPPALDKPVESPRVSSPKS
ncbi:GumC family protein [Altericista sp. CCNU0014]|uniref:GumC family protein n=1 Tax=Altericista sp. CCNU0014 TaxID=3082949 RepID=UPI00384A721B